MNPPHPLQINIPVLGVLIIGGCQRFIVKWGGDDETLGLDKLPSDKRLANRDA